MSGMDKLRELLDERGEGYSISTLSTNYACWWSRYAPSREIMAWEDDDYPDLVCVAPLTPEEAIDITLGPEPCHITYCESDYGADGWLCDGCGEWFAATYNNTPTNNVRTPNYCPSCGRKVVQP